MANFDRQQDQRRRLNGQTIVETILVLPFFLLLIFGLLQVGEIAVGLVTATYAAGSIARRVVQEGASSTTDGKAQLQNLMFGGMKVAGVQEGFASATGGLTADVRVNACVQIDPLPFVGFFLNPILGDHFSGNDNAEACDGSGSLGPLYFVPRGSGGVHYFVVRGTAQARMNYNR
jgi:hypothetical protein